MASGRQLAVRAAVYHVPYKYGVEKFRAAVHKYLAFQASSPKTRWPVSYRPFFVSRRWDEEVPHPQQTGHRPERGEMESRPDTVIEGTRSCVA